MYANKTTQRANILIHVPAYLKEHTPRFLTNRRDDSNAIHRALDEGAYELIRVLGHNMKGSGRTYGFEDITAIGERIEDAAEQKDASEIRESVRRLTDYLDHLVLIFDEDDEAAEDTRTDDFSRDAGQPHLIESMVTALIIDDSGATRNMLSLILKTTPIQVVGEAANGLTGIQLCQELHPDIVFLDIVMPGMSGIEVLRAIRQLAPDTMVFMMTSVSERETVLQTREIGACDYLLKPLSQQELKREVNRIYRRAAGEKR